MKLIAQVKLQPTQDQAEALRQTMLAYNNAANYISDQAWMRKTFRAYDLHHATYYAVREKFGLAAQLAIRVIKDVADAYKLDTKTKRTFRRMGSVTYDSRVLTWQVDKSEIRIWTMTGRQRIPFVCGERQRKMLETLQGETDLVYRNGEYYLHQPCNILESEGFDPDEWLGVDLGVANIAVDSTGEVHQGNTIKSVRYRQRRLRKKLQSKGTQSSRRRLRKLSGKERRFGAWVNHNISKRIVEKAERTGQGIALEDLKGIRERVRLRRPQRTTLHSWSFHQLRTFIEYKAQMLGVPVVTVDPRNTSRTCPCCGYIDKAGALRARPNQATFSCVDCGFSGLADHIAAMNIRSRAAVNPPYIPDANSHLNSQRQGQSSPF
jgi:IS605 OrfB family transposase